MSLQLNGTNQYASRTSAVVGVAPLGIFGWIKPTGVAARYTVAALSLSTNLTQYAVLAAAGDQASDPARYSTNGSGSFAAVNSSTAFTASAWHSFAGASFASNSHAAYLNGAGVSATATDAGALSGMNRTTIGAVVQSSGVSAYASGLIAEVGFWDLSGWGANAAARKSAWEAAIAAMSAGARVSAYPTGLMGFYPLISDALDGSGNGNHLTEIGSPTYSADNPALSYSSPSITLITNWW